MLDEYTSDKSIDEQPYQKLEVDVKNLEELKKDVRNVIHKTTISGITGFKIHN